MIKNILVSVITVVMLLGVFGLTACTSDTLDEYKTAGKTAIETYAQERKDNYSEDNWMVVYGIVETGKIAVDAAENKIGVDTAVNEAKAGINAVDVNMDFIEIVSDDMIELHTWYFTSGLPNNAIKVEHSDENAVFECIVDNGGFGFGIDSPKSIEVKSGDTFYWHTSENPDTVLHAYIEIIVQVDGNIVGLAVVDVSLKVYSPYSSHHEAKVLYAVSFPKQDGQYQSITTEQIKNKIEQIKIENEGK